MGDPPLLEGAVQVKPIVELPSVAVRLVGAPGTTLLLSLKAAEVNPGEEALTMYVPPVESAVNVVATASPEVSVVAVVVSVLFAKMPLAPLAGAVNVTGVPPTGTGLPCESSIVALNGTLNGVLAEAV